MYSEDVDDNGTASTSTPPSLLIDRLWKTNVVAWGTSSGNDSSSETSIEESASPPLRQGAEVLRPCALHLASKAFSHMSTESVLQTLGDIFLSSMYDTDPVIKPHGLEWIDDENLVIVWLEESGPRQAFRFLTGGTLLDEGSPLIVTRIGSIANCDAAARLALCSDVKTRGAASKSRYYQQRQEGRNPYPKRKPARASMHSLDDELDQIRGTSSRRQKEPASDKMTLDEELDQFRREGAGAE